MRSRGLWIGAVVAAGIVAAQPAAAQIDSTQLQKSLDRLIAAYPSVLDRVEGGDLVWKDGTRMPIDDGRGTKTHDQRLATSDIKDMFDEPYPPGPVTAPPAVNKDPGRARNAAFFDKMYGDCRKGEVEANLVDVVWLPKKWAKTVRVTRINGVADKLKAVSLDLDALPADFNSYLFPSAGAYVCRVIAGTARTSAHGHGIAIDLAVASSHYWQWTGAKAGTVFAYKNAMPHAIVEIFERHGFIWGGKWYHYDTMHFEYRPEMLR